MNPLPSPLRTLLLCTTLLCRPCGPAHAAQPLESFAAGRPLLDPAAYFAGHTRSWGFFEDRSGQPVRLIRTETWGRREGQTLHFEQDLHFAGRKKTHRSWLIRRLDAHHFSATGTGIVGTARGETRGNAFHLEFTLDAVPGNPLAHLRMSQWLYLQPDGVTLLNRATLSKGGVILREVTEQFRKRR